MFFDFEEIFLSSQLPQCGFNRSFCFVLLLLYVATKLRKQSKRTNATVRRFPILFSKKVKEKKMKEKHGKNCNHYKAVVS
jgi:hypothetical protein